MRLCLKCSKKVPYRVVIDGQKKFLANRKYCLSCSPFGSHNTRKLTGEKSKKIQKNCPRCGKITSRRTFCGSCIVTISRIKRKRKAVEFKGGKCEKCSYAKNLAALEFHHRDPSQKKFGISSGWNQSWEKTLQEILKCDLLCSNCHAENHHPEQNL